MARLIPFASVGIETLDLIWPKSGCQTMSQTQIGHRVFYTMQDDCLFRQSQMIALNWDSLELEHHFCFHHALKNISASAYRGICA